jgi:hypothetical protein
MKGGPPQQAMYARGGRIQERCMSCGGMVAGGLCRSCGKGMNAGGPVMQYAEGGELEDQESISFLIEEARKALMGQSQNPDMAISMFIERFGMNAFKQLQASVVQTSRPSNYIQGPGTGMSDSIPGMSNGGQPIRVSVGEYVVPADAVSGLGDGSSEAGARRLEQMIARVRAAKGNSQQPPPLDPKKVMPV